MKLFTILQKLVLSNCLTSLTSVSCAPSIYETRFAGLRHSDPALMTEDSAEITTNYPRNLDALTIS